MLLRLFIYGALGWSVEIVWTAVCALVTGARWDPAGHVRRVALTRDERLLLIGHTYLWMFPIYGFGGLAFETCHEIVRGWPWIARGALWTGLIFAVEYASGALLRRLTGRCPWDYGGARYSLDGLIRIDYAPLWFLFGLLLERVHDAVGAG